MCAFLCVFLFGCGNGGGGGTPSNPTNVNGRVLRAEDNSPEAGAKVAIGGQSTSTLTDGTFTLSNVDANAKTGTITPAAPAKARTLALSLTAKTANNLGDVFVSDTGYTASATGTVVAPIAGAQQPVGNATVTIAGSQTKTGTDGTFRIDNLPIGLGTDPNTAIGSISAPNFDTRPIFTPNLFETGVNALGIQLLGAPVGNTPPSQPYTITGTVTVGGKVPTSAATVTITNSGGQTLGTATTDANGAYFFWVVTGTYTITATSGSSAPRTVSVTLAALDTPVTVPVIAF